MALLTKDTRIGCCQYSLMDSYYYPDNAVNYFHFKTNIAKESYVMFFLEAVGYAYGAQAPVLCDWVGYAYTGTTWLVNTNTHTRYTGMTAHGLYQSSDNYVCIRGYCATPYFLAFNLNAITPCPTGNSFRVAITASVATSNSTNYYG